MADADYHSEEWRPIRDHENYEVSNFGRVRNTDWRGCGPRLLKLAEVRDGYLAATVNGKMIRVNRIVCEAFHGPPPFKNAHAAHNDGVRTNNREGNLRWATVLENAFDRQIHGTQLRGETNGKSKLTEARVREIRASSETGSAIARRLGLNKTTISAVRRRLTWQHVP